MNSWQKVHVLHKQWFTKRIILLILKWPLMTFFSWEAVLVGLRWALDPKQLQMGIFGSAVCMVMYNSWGNKLKGKHQPTFNRKINVVS